MAEPDKTRAQLGRYVAVAVGSALSDWVVFVAFVSLGGWHLHAQGVARLVGGLFSFTANKLWSFETGREGVTQQALRFMVLYGFSYVLSLGVLYGLADVLAVSPYLAKLAADTTCFAVNFVVMRSWVFRV